MHVPFAGHRHLLGRYFAPQRGRIVVLAALIVVDIGLRLLNPQIIRMFIDTAQAGGPMSTLTVAAVLFLVVGLLGRCISLGSSYAGLNLGWAATNRLRADLAAHLLRLDMPFHKTHTPGELIERVDGDVTTMAEFFGQMVVRVAGNALLVLAVVGFLYREDAGAGAAVTVYVLLVVAALAWVNRIGVRAWTASREAWAAQMGLSRRALLRHRGHPGYRRGGARAATPGRLALHALYKARAGWMAGALGTAVTNFLFIAGYGLGLAIGAALYLQGQVSIGTTFLIVSYIGMLSAPLEEIRWHAERFGEASAGINRVGDLFARQPAVADQGRSVLRREPLRLDFDRVNFRYADDGERRGPARCATSCCTMSPSRLAPGRVLGILGRTGSGKTTLTRLLLRLYDPESGNIRPGRTDLRALSFDALRSAVGLVTQDVQLFGATVRDNIALFDDESDDAGIERALASLGILDWVRAMPQGLSTKLAPGGGGMSAGEAPTSGVRPDSAARPGARRARRGSLPARPGHRAAARAGYRSPPGRQRQPAHGGRHRAPPAHGGPGRRHPDPGEGPRRGIRAAGRAGRKSRIAVQCAAANRHGGGAAMNDTAANSPCPRARR